MKKLLACTIILFAQLAITPTASRAANPVLFFSDLVDGPATGLGDGLGSGAIVTIWGTNLGSTQGTSFITSGGVSPAYIYYWKNADGTLPGGPADLYSIQKMQEIAFSIPATASGDITISVTVGGVQSNTLPFHVRSGKIYFAKSGGSDSNNGSWSSPWATISHFSGQLPPPSGSILYISGVTSGTCSVNSYLSGVSSSGSSGNMYYMVAYPNAKAGCTSGDTSSEAITDYGTPYQDYWGLSKMSFKGGAVIMDAMMPNWRVIANEITSNYPTDGSGFCPGNTFTAAVLAGAPKTFGLWYGNYTHDYGCITGAGGGQHVWYQTIRGSGTTTSQGMDWGWNHFKNNGGDSAMHVYDESGCGQWTTPMYEHDNVVENQVANGSTFGFACSSMQVTATAYVWNNLYIQTGLNATNDNAGSSVYHGQAISIASISPSSNYMTIYLFNNTFYGWGGDYGNYSGASVGCAINVTSFNGTLTAENNIFYDADNNPYLCGSSPNTHDHNLYYSPFGQSALSETAAVTANPLFVNPSGGFYTLQSGSPAIAVGANDSSVVTRDLFGTPRGNPPSLGAFEYIASKIPSPPTGLAKTQ